MNPEKDIEKWAKVIEMDLIIAHHMFEIRPIPLEIVCFHCQQAVEKMLKCFLVYNEIDPPKTHDIQSLLEMCIEIETDFDAIYNEAIRLNKYSVFPRYPADFDLDESDGATAIKYADTVMDFVKPLLKQ